MEPLQKQINKQCSLHQLKCFKPQIQADAVKKERLNIWNSLKI